MTPQRADGSHVPSTELSGELGKVRLIQKYVRIHDQARAAEVCWRVSARWRQENYVKYARQSRAHVGSFPRAPRDSGGVDSFAGDK